MIKRRAQILFRASVFALCLYPAAAHGQTIRQRVEAQAWATRDAGDGKRVRPQQGTEETKHAGEGTMVGVKTGGGFIVRWARRSDKSAQSSSGALASSAPGLLSFDEAVQLAVKNNLTTLLARERRNEARGVEF